MECSITANSPIIADNGGLKTQKFHFKTKVYE